MSVISEEKLKEIWSKFKPTVVPESMWGGELALELIQSFPDIVNLLDRALVKGEPLTEELSEKYQVPMGTDQGDTSLLAQGSRAFSDKFIPEGYESTTERAGAVKGLGAAIYDPLSKFAFKLGGAGQPEVAEEENRPGLRAHQFIGLAGPSAMTGQVARAVTGPVAQSTALKTKGSARVTLARAEDNFRHKYGLQDKNLLMDVARDVGENRFSVGKYTITQKNDLRKAESDIKALNRFQPRVAGKPVGDPYIPPWYKGPTAKYFHMLNMVNVALKNAKDAEAVLKGSEELFTPNVLKELQSIADNIPKVYSTAGAGAKGATTNVFADQLGHVVGAHQLYYPYSERTQWITENLGKNIFPDSVPLMNMRDFGASDIQALMEPYFRGALTDPKILDAHMTDFFKLGKNDGTLRLQTKPMFNLNNFKTSTINDSQLGAATWEGHGGNMWGVHSWRGKLPVVTETANILERWNAFHPSKRPELTQDYIIGELLKKNDVLRKDYEANVKNWKSQAWKHLPKAGNLVNSSLKLGEYWKKRPQLRLYNEKELRNNIKVANGYVSAQQQALIPDTMLATITGRAIWPKHNVDGGILVAADSYQMGSGGLDRPLAIGAAENNVFFYDAIPWNSAHNATQGKGKLLEMNGKPNSAVLANITKTGSYRELGEQLAEVPYMKESPLGPRHFLRKPPLKRTKKGVISYHEPQ